MSEVYDTISGILTVARVKEADAASLKMVTDEVLTNIMSYAYEEDADKWVMLEICLEGDVVTITFTDGGYPFDPLNAPEPDVTLSAEEREIGGLGIFLLRSIMDDVNYLRDGDRNILTVRKIINREK